MPIVKKWLSAPVFILVFIVLSIAADIHSYYRLAHQDEGKKGWTCKCDFRVFWIAAHKANNEIVPRQKGSEEYEKALKDYIEGDSLLIYDKSEPFYHFRYTPLVAFFMAPLAAFAYPADALIIWLVISSLAMLAALLLLTRQISSDFGASDNVRHLILWGTFLVSIKFYLMSLSIGQCDTLIALFFVLFLMAYVRKRDILCGAIFAVILQFKPLFLPALLYLLLTGRIRIVVSAMLWSGALLAAPAVVIGFDKTASLTKDWVEMMTTSVSSQLLNFKNQSLTYLAGKSLLNINAVKGAIAPDRLLYSLGAAFTLSAYAALLLFRRALKAGEDKGFKYLEVSFLVMITLIFSPLTWTAHFTSLIIPAGVTILFLSASRDRKPAYMALSAFLVLSLAMGTDLTKWLPFPKGARYVNIAFGTIFLMYAMIYSYKQRSRACKNIC